MIEEASNSSASGSANGGESGETDNALRSLGTQFNDPCLKSSTRILILMSSALNKRLGFTDLLSLTGTGKGSLSNHIEKLETSGYVKTKTMMTFGGPRVVVEITEKGMQVYENLVKTLSRLGK